MNSQAQPAVLTYEAIIGQIIKSLRESRFPKGGQAEVAALVGVTQPYWSKVEQGLANPSLTFLVKASEVLGVTHGELIRRAEAVCTEAQARGVRVVQRSALAELEWAPLLGAAAVGALIALVLARA